MSVIDQVEEDMTKALDDLETEAHQQQLQSRSKIVRCLCRLVGGRQPTPDGEDLAEPLLSNGGEDGLGRPLGFAKMNFARLLQRSLDNAMDAAEHEGVDADLLAQKVRVALEAVQRAHSPTSLISVIREVRRSVPGDMDPFEDKPLLSAYMCSLRIRWSYFFMFALILALALFSGEITEVFFAVFAVNTGPYLEHPEDLIPAGTEAWFEFWLLPFAVMLLALVGDEMSDLVLDAFDRPPLIWSLALVLAALQRDRKWAPAMRTCQLFDVAFIFLTEGIPLLNAMWCKLLGVGFWHGYMQGGLFAAFVATGITLFAEISISIHDVDGSDGQKAFRHVYHVLDKHKIFPGILSSRYDVFRAHFELVSRPPIGFAGCTASSELLRDTWRALRFLVHAVPGVVKQSNNRLAFCTMVLWTCVSVLAMWGLPVIASAVAMMLTVAILSIKMTMNFPQVTGPFYNVVLIFFLCVAIGLEAGTAFSITAEHITPLMMSDGFSAVHWRTGQQGRRRLPSVWLGNASAKSPYAICRMSWGSRDARLSALDVAALAWVAYEPDCAVMAELLRASFAQLGRSAPFMEACSPYDALPRWVSFYFPPSRPGGQGTRVFAVKGTSTWRDIYTDTKLFATIQVLQAFSKVVPILSLLPEKLVQNIVGRARTRGGGERHLWEDLERTVHAFQQRVFKEVSWRQAEVVLTGHSLGGCVAQIVASRLQLPALVFSAPGVVFSALRFGLPVERARHVMVVAPDGDMVAKVDRQAGVVQNIACHGLDGLPASAGACHSLLRTSCELWRACGDDRGRDFSDTCDPYIGPDPRFGQALGGGADSAW